MGAEITWRDIRALRATPPGLAREGERKQVFAAALQQAEELHTAAAGSGYASRSLPLFYALSQGGRAIAAARTVGGDWQLRGHGLKASLDADVSLTKLSQQSGAFDVLSRTTDSPELEGEPTVAALVATLPEMTRSFSSASHLRALQLELEYETTLGEYAKLVPPHGHLAIYCGPEASLPADEDQARRVDDLLRPYERATGWVINPSIRYSAGRPCIAFSWPREDPTGQRSYRSLDSVATQVGDYFYLRPTLGKSGGEISILMTWWAVLFALSSLARYEPAHWRNALDVDSSGTSVVFEEILDVAQEKVPTLLYEAITSCGDVF